MVEQLAERFRVTVVPASTTSADEVRELGPDGVFLSNGPGDPAALGAKVAVIADLLGTVPIFGICLGHQLLATALGAIDLQAALRAPREQPPGEGPRRPGASRSPPRTTTTPWRPARSARGVVTHVNLNDGVIEGHRRARERCFSVQYHPEAGPGPHDARYLFDRFEALLRTGAGERR